MKNSKKLLNLLVAGLASDLADKVIAQGYSLDTLKSITRKELSTKFSSNEVEDIWQSIRRQRIPEATVLRLIQECDWKCCMCWNFRKEAPIIIHHIEEHAKTHDDSYDNLVILCLNHHAKAHTKWYISQSPYAPQVIQERKAQWITAIAEFKAGLRPAPGSEPVPPTYPAVAAPAPPAHFTGRHSQCITVARMLLEGQRVALQGMGGIGKTAVAQQIAAESQAHFPGGILWAALADSEGDPRPVLRIWFWACNQELPAAFDLDSLASIVRGLLTARQTAMGRLLVVIDDARQEWLGAAQLLIQAIPGETALLVTTRQETVAAALNVQVYALNELLPHEALDLLKTLVDTSMMHTTSGIISELLSVVGYLPLAIELAGKRLGFLGRKPGFRLETFYQLVAERTLEQLTIPGHRGLAATFAITYEALSIDEQCLFRWIGAFAGSSVQVDSVSEVTGFDIVETEAMLDRLVECALLAWGTTAGGYTIHPLLHQYARVLLHRENGGIEATKAAQRHMEFFLAFAETNARVDVTAHDQLEVMLPDILAATYFAASADQHEMMNRLAVALWTDSGFLSMRGYIREGLTVLQQAIIACHKLGKRRDESIHLGSLGAAYSHLGHPQQAIEHYEQALAICRQIGDHYNECAYVGNLGLIYADIGQVSRAIEHYVQALDIGLATSNLEVVADQLGNLGSAFRYRDAEKSASYYTQSLAANQQRGDRRGEGNCLSNLGLIYFDKGQLDQATEYIQAALEISREIGDRKGEANRLGHLGNISLYTKQLDQAIGYFEQAVAINRKIGHRSNEANWTGSLGSAYRAKGQAEQGIVLYEQALAISREVDDLKGQRVWLANLGIAYRDLSNWERAIAYLEQSFMLSCKADDVPNQISCLDEIAKTYGYANQVIRAIPYYEQALALCQQVGNIVDIWRRLSKLGYCYASLNDLELARTCYEQALVTSHDCGDKRLECRSLYNLGNFHRAVWHLDQATHYYKESISLCITVADHEGEGIAASDLGITYTYLGQPEQAIMYLEQGLEVSREMNDSYRVALVLGNLGNAHQMLNNLDKATEYHKKALAICCDLGDQINEANWLGALGGDYRALNELELAVTFFDQALRISRESDLSGLEGRCLNELGYIQLDQGHVDQAAAHLEDALTISRALGDHHLEASCLHNLGIYQQKLGQLGLAQAYFEQALLINHEIGNRRAEAAVSRELGLLIEAFDVVRAVQLLSVTVAYEQSLNLPEADEHAQKVRNIQAQFGVQKGYEGS